MNSKQVFRLSTSYSISFQNIDFWAVQTFSFICLKFREKKMGKKSQFSKLAKQLWISKNNKIFYLKWAKMPAAESSLKVSTVNCVVTFLVQLKIVSSMSDKCNNSFINLRNFLSKNKKKTRKIGHCHAYVSYFLFFLSFNKLKLFVFVYWL